MMELFRQNSFLFPPNNPIINVQLGLKYASRCFRISIRTIASVCLLKKYIYFTVCCSKTLINNILLIIMRFKSSRSQMFFKIGVLYLKISKYLQEKACAESLFNCMPCLQLYRKETPTQEFSCEYCAIPKNIFFYRTLPVVASGV